MLEVERCQQCGRPKWICQNEDDDIVIDLRPETCQITAQIRAAQRKEKPDDPATDGKMYSFDIFTRSETPLVEFRDAYYAEKSKEQRFLDDIFMKKMRRPREHPPGWSPEEEEP